MTRRRFTSALPFMLAMVFAGCTGALQRAVPPDYNTSAGTAALAAYDTNLDGRIGGDELDNVPALKTSLGQVDANQDGQLTAEEIEARVQAWKDSRIAEMTVRCEVTLDGAPLPDAEVLFVPEAFLGPSLPSASGKTREDGNAGISMAEQHLANPRYGGVACGWYKIRVVSKNQSLPGRYNDETTLGCEVAMNASWVSDGAVKINLQSR